MSKKTVKTPLKQADRRINWSVFLTSSLLIGLFCLVNHFFPEQVTSRLIDLQGKLADSLGWYYIIIVAFYLIFMLFIATSRFGKIKLGSDDSKPEFSYSAWAGMLFSSGIGISMLYFGGSEALTHYLSPPEGQAQTVYAASQGIMYTFLHWGIHGWAIYALMAVTLGYSAYRLKQPLALRTGLYPLVGDKIKGTTGNIIDSAGIIVTVFGLVSNLGIGSLQISAGLNYLFGFEANYYALIIIMVIMTTAATLVAISGIEVGIRRLSNVNIILFISLLVFMICLGPSLYLFNTFTQNIADYGRQLVYKTFDVYAYQDDRSWLSQWTVFYWAWWIAWAPFVGLFFARISKGRQIREVVVGILLLPLGFTLAWLSVFGNSELNLVLHHNATDLLETAIKQPALTIYQLFSYYPMSFFISCVTLFVGFILFLTPADSGAVMLANLSVRSVGDKDAPHWLRIFWSVLIFAVTAGLIYFGNIKAIQTAIVLASLPFSVVLLLYAVGFIKALRKETPFN